VYITYKFSYFLLTPLSEKLAPLNGNSLSGIYVTQDGSSNKVDQEVTRYEKMACLN